MENRPLLIFLWAYFKIFTKNNRRVASLRTYTGNRKIITLTRVKRDGDRKKTKEFQYDVIVILGKRITMN